MLKFQNNNTTSITNFKNFILITYVIIDSFPLAVCKLSRAQYCKIFSDTAIDYENCPS